MLKILLVLMKRLTKRCHCWGEGVAVVCQAHLHESQIEGACVGRLTWPPEKNAMAAFRPVRAMHSGCGSKT